MVTSTPPIFRVVTYSVGYGLIGDRGRSASRVCGSCKTTRASSATICLGETRSGIDIDFLDPALFDDQLAEAHQQVFQCGQINGSRPRKPFLSAL